MCVVCCLCVCVHVYLCVVCLFLCPFVCVSKIEKQGKFLLFLPTRQLCKTRIFREKHRTNNIQTIFRVGHNRHIRPEYSGIITIDSIGLKPSNFFTLGHQQVRYIMAVDDSKSTMEEIIRSISKNLGTGKIKYISKEDALLEKELSQTAFDMLNVNLRLESTFVKEGSHKDITLYIP